MSISSTLIQRADTRFHEAAEPLRAFVGCFWVVTAERGATIRVVPDGSTSISIELPDGHASGWCLRGPLDRPDERCFASPATLVGIRLRPGVAYLLSGMAGHDLVGRRIQLSGIPAFHDLVAAGTDRSTPECCIEVLQRFLLKRLEHLTVNSVVAAALREIDREHGCVRVPDVAARCGVSPRQLHRLMRIWVGYGAKYYATIIRFQSTLHGMEQRPTPTGADLASDNGYFDQAHMTLDVARFAGATPGRLTSSGVADFSKTRCDDLP